MNSKLKLIESFTQLQNCLSPSLSPPPTATFPLYGFFFSGEPWLIQFLKYASSCLGCLPIPRPLLPSWTQACRIHPFSTIPLYLSTWHLKSKPKKVRFNERHDFLFWRINKAHLPGSYLLFKSGSTSSKDYWYFGTPLVEMTVNMRSQLRAIMTNIPAALKTWKNSTLSLLLITVVKRKEISVIRVLRPYQGNVTRVQYNKLNIWTADAGVEQIAAGGLLPHTHLTLTTPSPDSPFSISSSQKSRNISNKKKT